MKNKITDIFFDLDDTLWDFQRNSALTFAFIFSKNKLEIELDDFLKIYTPINEEYWRQYRRGEIDKTYLRHARLTDTFMALNLKISADIVHVLADDFMLHLADYNHLTPETIETLDYLYPKYNLHILTNGFRSVQKEKLQNSRLISYFKTVTTADEIEVKKPHPKIFEWALNKGKTRKENSVMIGDNFEADISGAKNAGLKSIFYNPLKKEGCQEYSIKSIGELKDLF